MGTPIIVYNSKTITLVDNDGVTGKLPFEWEEIPVTPGTRRRSTTGEFEAILQNMMDVQIRMDFRTNRSAAQRRKVDNFLQWAQQGNSFMVAFDSDHTVYTTLSASASAGASSIAATSASGILANRNYVLIDGPYRQMVTVLSVVGTTVTFVSGCTLDYAFSSGAVLREEWLWYGRMVQVPNQSLIRMVREGGPNTWEFGFIFAEDVAR